MHNVARHLAGLSLLTVLIACGGEDKPGSLFEPRPECEGEPVSPLQGRHPGLISSLAIGARDDGFDLDGDGQPDNKLSSIRTLANNAIQDAFAERTLLIPIELFDVAEPGVDECVKLGVYVGRYRQDRDGDGHETAHAGGDCDDDDAVVYPGAEEIAGNLIDDDCDGLADELPGDGADIPSDNVADSDADGVTLADGDCDDSNSAVTGSAEVCGDGLDNDCDGVADRGVDATGAVACDPYDATPDAIELDPSSFDDSGAPVVAFTAGEISDVDGTLELHAGPSLFAIRVPLFDDIALELRLTGATVAGDMVMTPAGWVIANGRLGGVIDARTADQVRGLEIPEIGLIAENSLLDAVFANLLGSFLGLPLAPPTEFGDACRTPDIDVDRDGLEIFCDSNPGDDIKTVDVCIDGDGSVVRDDVDAQGNVIHCSQATDTSGAPRFVDGISVMILFATTPVLLPDTISP